MIKSSNLVIYPGIYDYYQILTNYLYYIGLK